MDARERLSRPARERSHLVSALAIALGLFSGGPDGIELAWARAGGVGAAGIAAALFVVLAILAGQVTSLRAPWARVMVRVAESSVASIGLFMLGWLPQGA